jgi:GTP-binding protein EngB required for normal cell division
MAVQRTLRILVALGVVLASLLVLVVLLVLTETAFSVWHYLRELPGWFVYSYAGGLLALLVLVGTLLWRLLGPRRQAAITKQRANHTAPSLDRESLRRRMDGAEAAGIDVSEARRELASLSRDQGPGEVRVALFGEISSGKSSLIRALVPEARPEVNVRGGTTTSIDHYIWESPAGDRLVLMDMPGTNQVGGGLDERVREEAMRAHAVVYVCDADLTRSQYAELGELLALGKPSVLALNKTDRFSAEELEALKARLKERLAGGGRVTVTAVRSGGIRELVRVLPDGREETVQRPLVPQVGGLQVALQRVVDRDPRVLDDLRDSAVFVLVDRKLDAAIQAGRRNRAEELVRGYARKAVIGAMAAVTPGTDILVQGYLGTRLVQSLCKLYEVPVRQIDLDRLLELVQRRVGRAHTLVLAIAGNALKAFPGVGTLAGGLLHAVAYGLVFDSLGKAVAKSLGTRGELHPLQAADTFRETLFEDLETSARRFAKLALRERQAPERGRSRG